MTTPPPCVVMGNFTLQNFRLKFSEKISENFTLYFGKFHFSDTLEPRTIIDMVYSGYTMENFTLQNFPSEIFRKNFGKFPKNEK